MKDFLSFMLKYNRPYTHRLEVSQRYRIFKNNYAILLEHNKRPAVVPFLLEVNQFSDMTQAEFETSYTGLRLPEYYVNKIQSGIKVPYEVLSPFLPQSIDWN
jgi:hypothetical protein